MAEPQKFVHSPLFPTYSVVRQLLKIWPGIRKKSVTHLIKSLWDLTGTPQNPVDWSDPDNWIGERLVGEDRTLANKIWLESSRTINPRHLYGAHLFINQYALLSSDPSGSYGITERGTKFLDNDLAVVRAIDEAEGLPKLLNIVAAHSPAKRGDILEEWETFLLAHSNYRTPATIKGTLSHRMLNLVDRGFIDRVGNTYTINAKGIAYAADIDVPKERQPHHQVLGAIKVYNDSQIEMLRERLSKMDPYLFESLVKDLLEAMDYEDVEVTKQSGDKGIDVVANYEFGITQIREVVQVKRQQGTITRPILDQLRGALPYYQAIRGTLITLGKFAQGCKDAALYPGAAPITLIDGDKLIELMLKHEVGIKKTQQILLEVDESYFAAGDTETPAEAQESEEVT